MKSIIIYDSYFGNTQQIAQAVYDVLAEKTDALLLKTNEVAVSQITEADIFVIGSPTRAFNATPPVKALLKKIPKKGLQNMRVAAFDTRMRTEDIDSKFLNKMMNVFGYAAEPLAAKLVKKGGNLAVPAEGFIVKDDKGPLLPGEIERAQEWAKKILKDQA